MPTDGGKTSAEVLNEASSVLLLAPAVRETAADAAAALIEQGTKPYDRVVAVTIGGSAGSWLGAWQRQAGSDTRVSCIDVEGDTRGAAEADGGCTHTPVETITDPTDLETLGRTISTELEGVSGDDNRVAVAIHSVSDLLFHVDEPTVFKFVYTLGEVVRRVNGTVYFHMDETAHDEETIETFAATCDAVVELDGRAKVTPRRNW